MERLALGHDFMSLGHNLIYLTAWQYWDTVSWDPYCHIFASLCSSTMTSFIWWSNNPTTMISKRYGQYLPNYHFFVQKVPRVDWSAPLPGPRPLSELAIHRKSYRDGIVDIAAEIQPDRFNAVPLTYWFHVGSWLLSTELRQRECVHVFALWTDDIFPLLKIMLSCQHQTIKHFFKIASILSFSVEHRRREPGPQAIGSLSFNQVRCRSNPISTKVFLTKCYPKGVSCIHISNYI